MSEYKIASRYAKALFDKSVEDNVLDAVKTDIEHLLLITNESREFVLFLNSPLYKMTAKKGAINKLFESANPLTKGVFALMVEKFRESFIPAMGRAFIQMYNRKNQIVEAIITSAVTLEASEIKRIENYIIEQTQAKSVLMNQLIDKEIIGGITIEFDGKIYDNTIISQLNKVKKELQIA
jgi:F-type H+-transporting ATPase subunit delta